MDKLERLVAQIKEISSHLFVFCDEKIISKRKKENCGHCYNFLCAVKYQQEERRVSLVEIQDNVFALTLKLKSQVIFCQNYQLNHETTAADMIKDIVLHINSSPVEDELIKLRQQKKKNLESLNEIPGVKIKGDRLILTHLFTYEQLEEFLQFYQDMNGGVIP